MAKSPKTDKVLVLASTFPRWENDHEPRFVEFLCKELTKTHQISVLAPHYKGAKRFEKLQVGASSIEVNRFRYWFPALQTLAYEGGILTNIHRNGLNLLLVPFFLAAQLFKIISLNRQNDYDVIHAHWIIPQGLVAAIFVSLWPNAPRLVVTAHGGDLFALRGRFFESVKRWIFRRSTKITVVSEVMKTKCEELGVSKSKLHVRSMGVDLTSGFTSELPNSDRHNLIFVGRLVEKKGVPHLIRAMALLTPKHPKLQLTIVGDGPERMELEAITRQLQIEHHISFLGHRMNSELPTLLRASKILVMPSIVARSGDQEGLGLVAVEAMGCGCVVVATDLPAIRDSVRHKETGLIASAGDETDLASKIELLLCDDALVTSIAESARKFALQKFDWAVVGREYSKILSDI